jgi:hypothetical protein
MWINLLESDKAIKAIFEEAPSLKSVFLHDIIINNYGPSIEIRLDLNEYPRKPPIKWKASKFNTVQIIIELWSLTNMKMDGLLSGNLVDITIDSNKNGILLKIDGDFTLSCEAELVDLKKISAYQNSPE